MDVRDSKWGRSVGVGVGVFFTLAVRKSGKTSSSYVRLCDVF